MNCQKCHKPATFHITDLSGEQIAELHFCPDCAKEYLNPPEEETSVTPTLANLLANQLNLGQTAEELAELDSKECPICGITFYEFRQEGRLGCPYDYTYFGDDLKHLLINVHSSVQHVGKQPQHGAYDPESQNELIRVRREMKEAVENENYERASELRDRIREIEEKG